MNAFPGIMYVFACKILPRITFWEMLAVAGEMHAVPGKRSHLYSQSILLNAFIYLFPFGSPGTTIHLFISSRSTGRCGFIYLFQVAAPQVLFIYFRPVPPWDNLFIYFGRHVCRIYLFISGRYPPEPFIYLFRNGTSIREIYLFISERLERYWNLFIYYGLVPEEFYLFISGWKIALTLRFFHSNRTK